MSDNKAEATPGTPAQAEAAAKNQKISKMTVQEIDAALAACKEKQGGLHSKYARQLAARKKALSPSAE